MHFWPLVAAASAQPRLFTVSLPHRNADFPRLRGSSGEVAYMRQEVLGGSTPGAEAMFPGERYAFPEAERGAVPVVPQARAAAPAPARWLALLAGIFAGTWAFAVA